MCTIDIFCSRILKYKLLSLILSFGLVFFPVLLSTMHLVETNVLAIGENIKGEGFLEHRKNRRFWGWLYRLYMQNPEEFDEWTVMCSTIFVMGVMGGTGYGVYKYFNPVGIDYEDFGGKYSKRSPKFGKLSIENNDLLKDIDKEETVSDAYNRVYARAGADIKTAMDEKTEYMLCKYNERMKGTGKLLFMFKERMSTRLQGFRDRACKLKVLLNTFELPEDLKKRWLEELKEQRICGKKLTDKDYHMICDFIAEQV